MDKFHSFWLKVSTYFHSIPSKLCTLSLEHIQVRLGQKFGNKNIQLNFNEFLLLSTFLKRMFVPPSDANTMKLLFTSLVRPHLEYANAIWSPRLKKDNNLIEGVLRRATKLIPGMKDLDYSERLKKINIPSMKYRRERGDMIEVYKFIHGKYDMTPPLSLQKPKKEPRATPTKSRKPE